MRRNPSKLFISHEASALTSKRLHLAKAQHMTSRRSFTISELCSMLGSNALVPAVVLEHASPWWGQLHTRGMPSGSALCSLERVSSGASSVAAWAACSVAVLVVT